MTPEERQLYEAMSLELEELKAESDRLANGSWWYRLVHSWGYWRREADFDRRLDAMWNDTVEGLEKTVADRGAEPDTRNQAITFLAQADQLNARKKALKEVREGRRRIEDL